MKIQSFIAWASIAFFMLIFNSTFAQVAINTDNADAHASAILDVKSTDKGVLIPRMTATQRDNITSPATGLMVYVTNDNSFYFFNGTAWQIISVGNQLADADNDTKIQVEENADEDKIRFDVGGVEYFSMKPGRIASNNSGNSVYIGADAGESDNFTNNNRNVGIGVNALQSITAGGYSNTAIGYQANGSNVSGDLNTVIGSSTMNLAPAGDRNSIVGAGALSSNTYSGIHNTLLGFKIAGNVNANNFQRNTMIGSEAGGGVSSAVSYNVYLGYRAGFNETNSNRLYIENSTADHTGALIYGEFDNDLLRVNGTLNINGAFAFPTTDGSSGQVLATNGSGALTWTSISESYLRDADNDTKIQVEENADEDIIRFDINGAEKWTMTGSRLESKNTGSSIFIGENSGENDDLIDNRNVFIGYQAGQNNTSGRFNVFSGYKAGQKNTSGWQNVYIGNQAGTENTTGGYNVYLGNDAGRLGTTGTGNTLLGWGAGRGNTTGDNNLYLGRNSGYNNTLGANNVFIGAFSGENETGSNKLYIENSNSATPLIYGEFDNDFVKVNGKLSSNAIGIGTDAPSKALELVENANNLQMPLLVRNKSGIDTGGSAVGIGFHVEPQANREPKAAIVQERTGNYGRGAFHFLLNNDTNTDGVDLNDAKVTITPDGKMGIGTKTPSATLDVVGDVELNGTLNINNAFSLPTADGTSGQVLTTNGSGNVTWANQTTDDLGNHTATQNIQIGSNYISNDGDNEGISIGTNGDLKVQTASSNNRPAVFSSAYNGGGYIEVNNAAGTRALFGPSGAGFGSSSTNHVNIANWSNGDLRFFTNATERMALSKDGLLTLIGNFQLFNGSQGNGKILVSNAFGLGTWTDPAAVFSGDNLGNHIATQNIQLNGKYLSNDGDDQGILINDDGVVSINSLRITGGSPANGEVLTTDADGDIVLEDPSERVAFVFDQTQVLQDANGLSGWFIVSDYTNALNVKTGDVITVRITFTAALGSGSGSDDLRFRVYPSGTNGCPHAPGGETNYLSIYRNNRGHDMQTAVQYTFTATCDGTYQFALQSDFTNVDDDVLIDQVQITAVKY